jgi:hypothetical protein
MLPCTSTASPAKVNANENAMGQIDKEEHEELQLRGRTKRSTGNQGEVQRKRKHIPFVKYNSSMLKKQEGLPPLPVRKKTRAPFAPTPPKGAPAGIEMVREIASFG